MKRKWYQFWKKKKPQLSSFHDYVIKGGPLYVLRPNYYINKNYWFPSPIFNKNEIRKQKITNIFNNEI